MELCDCTLQDLIALREQHHLCWEEADIVALGQKFIGWLQQLNSKNVCHRDIKPQNIYYSARHDCFKLGDYTEGKLIQSPQLNNL